MLQRAKHTFFVLLMLLSVCIFADEAEIAMPTPDLTSPFSTYNKVVRVYDGDTITIEADNGNKVSLRLLGVNTQEIKDKDPTKKKRAKDARDWLRDLILDKHVFIVFERSEKTLDGIARGSYCRPLSYVFIRDEEAQENIFVNLELAWQGHGEKYFKYDFEYKAFFRLSEEAARKRIKALDLSQKAAQRPR